MKISLIYLKEKKPQYLMPSGLRILYSATNKQGNKKTKYMFISLINIPQARCGLSGINDEKNVDMAVSKRRDVVTWFSAVGPSVGGGGGCA